MTNLHKIIELVRTVLSTIKRDSFPASCLAPFAVYCAVGISATIPLPGDSSSPATLAIRFYQKYISDLRSGRCRFEPSCSEYARQAIEARGLVIGSAMAADRLIRCNRSAGDYYVRRPSGRLLDPVEGETQTKKMPVVPSWLLPPIESALPLHDLPDTALSQRLREYADFADELAARGDCWRAQTEYDRVAYTARAHEIDLWVKMKTGACYFGAGDWDDAASHFSQVVSRSQPGKTRNTACYMTAVSRFNSGDYSECNRTLSQCAFGGFSDRTSPEFDPIDTEPGPVSAEDCLLLNGLSSMALGDWEVAAEAFKEVSQVSPRPFEADIAEFLTVKSENADRLPHRNPRVASVFSAILPGSGQVYAGRPYDGMRHFLFNGLMGYLVYRTADDGNYAGTYLLAGIALPFYMGNVLGAGKSARQFNKSKRLDYLCRTIASAPLTSN